jgi:hypothetical protein
VVPAFIQFRRGKRVFPTFVRLRRGRRGSPQVSYAKLGAVAVKITAEIFSFAGVTLKLPLQAKCDNYLSNQTVPC